MGGGKVSKRSAREPRAQLLAREATMMKRTRGERRRDRGRARRLEVDDRDVAVGAARGEQMPRRGVRVEGQRAHRRAVPLNHRQQRAVARRAAVAAQQRAGIPHGHRAVSHAAAQQAAVAPSPRQRAKARRRRQAAQEWRGDGGAGCAQAQREEARRARARKRTQRMRARELAAGAQDERKTHLVSTGQSVLVDERSTACTASEPPCESKPPPPPSRAASAR